MSIDRILTLIALIADRPEDPPALREPLSLKRIHSLQVADTCLSLARTSGCGEADAALAFRMGLCHDLGRFPQFRRYRTFDDRLSCDHGRLSLRLISGLRLDSDLSDGGKALLRGAIGLHNRFMLPEGLTGRIRFFAALLRDADRLDIFRVFSHYYTAGPTPDSPLELGYPDTGRLSPDVIAAVGEGRSPSYGAGLSVQDIRLIKLTWAYTMETPGAGALFQASGFLEATRRALPDTETVRAVLADVEARLSAMP